MDLTAPLIILLSILSVALPVFGTIAIWGAVCSLSPYVRRVFSRGVGWRSPDRAMTRISLSLTPWAFLVVGTASVTIAFLLEIVAAIALGVGIGDPDISTFFLLVLAGPIEEGAKLVVAAAAFGAIGVLLSKVRGRDPAKDAILVGLFVGCSFGLFESVGYLVIGFSDVLSDGITLSTVDPVAWRVLLGVLIHGLYTAIASVGIGRGGPKEVVRWTIVGLSSAVLLHSTNNGIQGLFLLLLDMEGTGILLLIDLLQAGLVAIGSAIILYIWNMRPSYPLSDNRPNSGDIAQKAI